MKNRPIHWRPGKLKDDGTDLMLRLKQKLLLGKEVTYVVYGDSISAGGEASEEGFAYYRRLAARLTELYPQGSFPVPAESVMEAYKRGDRRIC